jgi:hypothetical protein
MFTTPSGHYYLSLVWMYLDTKVIVAGGSTKYYYQAYVFNAYVDNEKSAL